MTINVPHIAKTPRGKGPRGKAARRRRLEAHRTPAERDALATARAEREARKAARVAAGFKMLGH